MSERILNHCLQATLPEDHNPQNMTLFTEDCVKDVLKSTKIEEYHSNEFTKHLLPKSGEAHNTSLHG